MSEGIYERDRDLQLVHERDDALLASLGYKSEFKRDFLLFWFEPISWLQQVWVSLTDRVWLDKVKAHHWRHPLTVMTDYKNINLVFSYSKHKKQRE